MTWWEGHDNVTAGSEVAYVTDLINEKQQREEEERAREKRARNEEESEVVHRKAWEEEECARKKARGPAPRKQRTQFSDPECSNIAVTGGVCYKHGAPRSRKSANP